MRLKALAVSLLFAALSVVPSLAQEDWPEEVVVRGKTAAGPAMWRVTKSDSQILILGILPVFPKKQAWSTKRVENALRGANRLIAPPASSTGLGDLWLMMSQKNLPGGAALKDSLPPALYARYLRTAQRAGVSVTPFARDKPVWAGARLRRAALPKLGLSDSEPLDTVKALARQAGVPLKTAGHYDIGPLFKAVNAMDMAASQACLTYTLDDIDFDIDRAPIAARAWAVGDISTVRANYQGSTLSKCLAGSPLASSTLDRSVTDSFAAVTAAAKLPGKTVAVLPLAALLRKGGVLERLRAAGYAVSSPQD